MTFIEKISCYLYHGETKQKTFYHYSLDTIKKYELNIVLIQQKKVKYNKIDFDFDEVIEDLRKTTEEDDKITRPIDEEFKYLSLQKTEIQLSEALGAKKTKNNVENYNIIKHVECGYVDRKSILSTNRITELKTETISRSFPA